MAKPPEDPFDYDPFDDEKDYSVLLAEADKVRADGKLAVKKAQLWDATDAMIARANEITAWKAPPLDGAVGR